MLLCCAPPGLGRIDRRMESIISRATVVESFNVSRACIADSLEWRNCFAGFNVVERGSPLSGDQAQVLKNAILDQSNHSYEQLKCGFNPRVGFRFTRGNDQVDVLLDFSCSSWRFASDDSRAQSQFTPVAVELSALADELFPGIPGQVSY